MLVKKTFFHSAADSNGFFFLTTLFIAHIVALVGIAKSGTDLRQMSGGEFLAFFIKHGSVDNKD